MPTKKLTPVEFNALAVRAMLLVKEEVEFGFSRRIDGLCRTNVVPIVINHSQKEKRPSTCYGAFIMVLASLLLDLNDLLTHPHETAKNVHQSGYLIGQVSLCNVFNSWAL